MPPSLLWFLLSLCAGDYTTFTPRYSADPSPLVVGDRLYVYTTHDEVGATSFAMQDYNVFSTTDGVNWRDDGIAFSPVHNTTWAKNAWAQQVIWHAPLQRFIMYFPGMGNPSVGVAVATDPRGPFVDYALEAIAPGEDPTVFVDDDGTPILCSATSTPYNMPWCGVLNQDMKSWRVPQSQLHINGLSPGDFFEAPWLFKYDGVYYLSFMEDYSFGSSVGAPFGWSLGYATNASPNPLGNYTYRGPLLWANPRNCDNAGACGDGLGFVGGNTHHGFALDFPTGSGKHWLLYHTRNLAVEKGQVTFSQRNVAMDRVYFFNNSTTTTTVGTGSGVRGGIVTPVASTPTGWVQQLHWVDPYQVQPAASFAAGVGTSLFLGTQPAVDCDPQGGQWRYLWNASSGDAMRVRGVDFGGGGGGGGGGSSNSGSSSSSSSNSSSGSSSMDSPTSPTTLSFTARVATPNGGCVLEVYVDGVPGGSGGGGGGGGVLIASAPVPNTGGWEVFTNITTPIQPVAVVGVHDLYFVFQNTAHGGGGGQLGTFNFASWGFAMKGVERRGVGMVLPLPPKKSPPPPPVHITAGLTSVALVGGGGAAGVSAPLDPLLPLTASGENSSSTFTILDGENGYWGLRAASNGLFVTCEAGSDTVGSGGGGGNELWVMTASSTTLGAPGTLWRLSGTPDGSYALIAEGGGFVTAGPLPASPLHCNGTEAGSVGARFILNATASGIFGV